LRPIWPRGERILPSRGEMSREAEIYERGRDGGLRPPPAGRSTPLSASIMILLAHAVIHLIATLHTLSSLIQLFSVIGIVYSVKVIGKVIVNECHSVCPVRFPGISGLRKKVRDPGYSPRSRRHSPPPPLKPDFHCVRATYVSRVRRTWHARLTSV
jgi:hypothetical protein